MAWKRAGSCRNSLISCSSSTASSQPATSAKVTEGSSFETCLARDLPNCMTPRPPPCMTFMISTNAPTSSTIGSTLNSRPVHSESDCGSVVTSTGGSASCSSSTSSSAYSAGKETRYSVSSAILPTTSWSRSLISAVATSPSSIAWRNSERSISSRSGARLENRMPTNRTAAPMRR